MKFNIINIAGILMASSFIATGNVNAKSKKNKKSFHATLQAMDDFLVDLGYFQPAKER